MRTPAAAFAWEFQRQHRLGLTALALYLLAFVAIKVFVLPAESVLRVDPPNGLAACLIVPVTAMMFYLVGAFTFGLSGDLAARPSIYPAHKLALPVTSRALAGWPMLYGAAALFVLSVVTALLLRWLGTGAFVVPVIWPGLLIATYLAWTQAFMWMPYGLPGIRVVLAVLFLTAVDAIVFVALEMGARELTMILLLAPQLPVAYLLACIAVARARRGEVPDWRLWRSRAGNAIGAASAQTLFGTSARAQLWFEWRQHGWTLPAMVALVIPAELLLWFIPVSTNSRTVFVTLFAVIITPPFLAAFAAGRLAAPTSFTAIRPLTTASLAAAKLGMSILSTLLAWIIVAVAIAVAAALSGRSAALIERARDLIEVTGPLRFFVVAGLIVGAAALSTFTHLVQSLCLGLSGRPWLIKSAVLAALAALIALAPAFDWIADRPDVQSAIWHGLPWMVAAVVIAKATVASAVAMRLHQRRLLGDGALIVAALCWLATVATLYAVQSWLAESPLVPGYVMGAVAILPVPLTRVAAVPLALAWSRHR